MWLLLPVLLTLHIAVCLLLVLVVLMQLPRSEGLGAAFGGGVTENIFGPQTTHVLAKFTVWLGIAFFVLTLLLAIAYTHKDSGRSQIQKDLLNAPAPAAAVAPAVLPEASPAASPLNTDVNAISAPTVAPEAVTPAASPAEVPSATPATPEAAASPAASPVTAP